MEIQSSIIYISGQQLDQEILKEELFWMGEKENNSGENKQHGCNNVMSKFAPPNNFWLKSIYQLGWKSIRILEMVTNRPEEISEHILKYYSQCRQGMLNKKSWRKHREISSACRYTAFFLTAMSGHG